MSRQRSDRRSVAGPGQEPGHAAPWRRASPPPSSWSRASMCRSCPTCTISAPTTPAGCSSNRSRATWSCWLDVSRAPPSGCSTATASRATTARTRSRRRPTTDEDEEGGEPEPPKGIGSVEVPDRHIYCLDLRDYNSHDIYVEEVRRIAAECRERREAQLKTWIQGQPTMVQLGRYLREEEPAGPDAAVRPGAIAATAGPALVSGDRLQPLHQLHGVPRFLPVRRLRRGQAGSHHWSRTRTTASAAARRAAASVPSRPSCSPTTRRPPSPAPRSATSAG